MSDEIDLEESPLIRMAGSNGKAYQFKATDQKRFVAAVKNAGIQVRPFLVTEDRKTGERKEYNPFLKDDVTRMNENIWDKRLERPKQELDAPEDSAWNHIGAGLKGIFVDPTGESNPLSYMSKNLASGVLTAAGSVARGVAKVGTNVIGGAFQGAVRLGENLNSLITGDANHELSDAIGKGREAINKGIDWLTPDVFEKRGMYDGIEGAKESWGIAGSKAVVEQIAELKGMGLISKGIQAQVAGAAAEAKGIQAAGAVAKATKIATSTIYGVSEYADMASDPNGPGGVKQEVAALVGGAVEGLIWDMWDPFEAMPSPIKPSFALFKDAVRRAATQQFIKRAALSGTAMAAETAGREAIEAAATRINEQKDAQGNVIRWNPKTVDEVMKTVASSFAVGSLFASLDVLDDAMMGVWHKYKMRKEGVIPGMNAEMKRAITYRTEKNREIYAPMLHRQAETVHAMRELGARIVERGVGIEYVKELLPSGEVRFIDGSVWRPAREYQMLLPDGETVLKTDAPTITVADGTILDAATGKLVGYAPSETVFSQVTKTAEESAPGVAGEEVGRSAAPETRIVRGDGHAVKNAKVFLDALKAGQLPVDTTCSVDSLKSFNFASTAAPSRIDGEWEQTKAEPIVVYLGFDGTRTVVSGEKRVEAARAAGSQTINAVYLKESDGWTPQDAEVVPMLENLRQGRGTMADLLKVNGLLGDGELDELARFNQRRGNTDFAGECRRALVIQNRGADVLADEVRAGILDGRVAFGIASTVNLSTAGEHWQVAQKALLQAAHSAHPEEMYYINNAVADLVNKRSFDGDETAIQDAVEAGRARYAQKKGGVVTDHTAVQLEDGKISTMGRLQAERASKDGAVSSFSERATPLYDAAAGAGENLGVDLKVREDGFFGCAAFPNLKVDISSEGIFVGGITAEELANERVLSDTAALVGKLKGLAEQHGKTIQVVDADVLSVFQTVSEQIRDQGKDAYAARHLDARRELIDHLTKSRLAAGATVDEASWRTAIEKEGTKSWVNSRFETYGCVTPDGQIHLNPLVVDFNTPIHEYGHLAIEAAKEVNPALIERGLKLARASELFKTLHADEIYGKMSEAELADEVLAKLIGDKGELLVREKGLGEKLKAWFREFWATFKQATGIADLSAAEIQNLSLDQIAELLTAETLKGGAFGKAVQSTAVQNGKVVEISKGVKLSDFTTKYGKYGENFLVARGQTLVNKESGVEAVFSKQSFGKLISSKAVHKSIENGFTAAQHNAAVEQIQTLFENSFLLVERGDKAGDVNVKAIRRFASPVKVNGKWALAWITTKESTEHGNRMYSVEMIELRALTHKSFERVPAGDRALAISASKLTPYQEVNAADNQIPSGSIKSNLSKIDAIVNATAVPARRNKPPKRMTPRMKAVQKFIQGDTSGGVKTALLDVWLHNGGRLFDAIPATKSSVYKNYITKAGHVGSKKGVGLEGFADEFTESLNFYKELSDGERKIFFGTEKLPRGAIGQRLHELLTAEGVAHQYEDASGQLDYEKVVDDFRRQWDAFEGRNDPNRTLSEEDYYRYLAEREVADQLDRERINDEYWAAIEQDPLALGALAEADLASMASDPYGAAKLQEAQAALQAELARLRDNGTTEEDIEAQMMDWGVRLHRPIQDETKRQYVEPAMAAEKRGEVGVFYLDNEKAAKYSAFRVPHVVKRGLEGSIPSGSSSGKYAAFRVLVKSNTSGKGSHSTGVIHSIAESGADFKGVTSQTETKQFKRLFKGSKIVDENGAPLVVYHGTDAEFDAFDPIGTFGVDEKRFRLSRPIWQRAKERRATERSVHAIESAIDQGSGIISNPELGEIQYNFGTQGEKGQGIAHIIQKRMSDGASLDDAAEIAVRVGISASIGKITETQRNKRFIDYDGVRAIVALNSETHKLIVTGYEINADDLAVANRRAANLRNGLPHVRSEEMVAALKRAIDKLRAHDYILPHELDGVNSDGLKMSRSAVAGSVFEANAGARERFMAMGETEQSAAGLLGGIEKARALRPWTQPGSPAAQAQPLAFDSADLLQFWRKVIDAKKLPTIQDGYQVVYPGLRKSAVGLNVGGHDILLAGKLFGMVDKSDWAKQKQELQQLVDDHGEPLYFKHENPMWRMYRTKEEIQIEQKASQEALRKKMNAVVKERVLTGKGGEHYAAEVFAHEIGHTLHWLGSGDHGVVMNAARNLLNEMTDAFRRKGNRKTKDRESLRQEIEDLISWWHTGETGKCPSYYTKEPKERFAELFGIFLTQPQSVADRAKRVYETCVDVLKKNPRAWRAYRELQGAKWNGKADDNLWHELEKTWDEDFQRNAAKLEDEAKEGAWSRWDEFNYVLNDQYGPMFALAKRTVKAETKRLQEDVKKNLITQDEMDLRLAAMRETMDALRTSLYNFQRQSGGEERQIVEGLTDVLARAEEQGVGWKNVRRYAHAMRVIEIGGRATAHGIDPARAAKMLEGMKAKLGDEMFARIEETWQAFRAIYEASVLDDPRVQNMFDAGTNQFLRDNKHYVTMKHTMSAEELADYQRRMEEYRKTGKDDPAVDLFERIYRGLSKVDGTSGLYRLQTIKGSFDATHDPLAMTIKKAIEIKRAAARNQLVSDLAQMLVTCQVKDVIDNAPTPVNNKRFGSLSYLRNGEARTLIVPEIIARGFKTKSNPGFGEWGAAMRGLRNTMTLWNPAFVNRAYLQDKAALEANVKGLHKSAIDVIAGSLPLLKVPVYAMDNYLTRFTNFSKTWIGKLLYNEHTVGYYAREAQKISEIIYDGKFGEVAREAEELAKAGRTDEANTLREQLAVAKEMLHRNMLQSMNEFNKLQGATSVADISEAYGYNRSKEAAKTWKDKTLRGVKKGAEAYMRFEQEQEAITKIIAFLYDSKMNPNRNADARARFVIEQGGTPNLSARGVWATNLENCMGFFWNVKKQSFARSVDAFLDHPTEYAVKAVAQSILPAVVRGLITCGGLGWLVSQILFDGDEEKMKKSKLAPILNFLAWEGRALKNVPAYQQRNYHIVPIATLNGGTFALRVKYSPEEYAVVNAVHTAMNRLMPNPTDPDARPEDVVKAVWDTIMPPLDSGNPALLFAEILFGPFIGLNPHDSFRGRDVFSDDAMLAKWTAPGYMAEEWGTNLWNYSPLGTLVGTIQDERDKTKSVETPAVLDVLLNKIPVLSKIPASCLGFYATPEANGAFAGARRVDNELRAVARLKAREALAYVIEHGGSLQGVEKVIGEVDPTTYQLAMQTLMKGYRAYHRWQALGAEGRARRQLKNIKFPKARAMAEQAIRDAFETGD